MKMELPSMLLPVGGLIIGGLLGYAFGLLQRSALRRYEERERRGTFRSGWAIAPGSLQRTAFLLLALMGIQFAFPLLFERSSLQWIVSAGVVVGYGWTLLQRLKQRAVGRA